MTSPKNDHPCIENDELYRALFERNRAIKLLIDPSDGAIIDANPAACDFYGYARNEMRGMNITKINLLSLDVVRERMDRVKNGEQVNFVFKHRLAGGEMRDVVVNSGRVDFQEKTLLLSIIHDISDRVKAETALKESHEQFLTVLNGMDANIYVADTKNYEIIFANKHFKDTFGENVIGRTCHAVIQGEKESPCFFCINRQVHAVSGSDRDVMRWEYQSSVNGKWYQALERIINWIDGRPVRISIAMDITEKKRLEREILNISENERIRIGHDLHDGIGQYFTGMGYLVRILRDRLQERNDSQASVAEELLSLIDEAKGHVRMLARGLSPVQMDTKGLFMAVKDLCIDTEKMFRCRCSFTYDKALGINDNATATHIYYIIREAVSNAIRHGEAENIDIIIKEYKKGLMITICDDGHGISDTADLDTGLGLKLMKYRADVINALLSVEKNNEKGMTVTIMLASV
ncbi:MAG: hypothetical protein CVV44_03500 [Spirochaetae bacterium HGW-Spirochaetae-1]|jgi:PAS domain S-box-containing protein|nr:MAG: hypothetical protein CVV44_03500 [Spirochaetae bacterium HGW-Spirochaetae-1]